ncbi:MAG TPA: M14 family metallopeptidase [Phycisphaerae bacterium]|nr:M14 family metallopeptidase [Phycisphaerae bacterium]HNU46110.1 M14 family metallopeptidase [Phycisphaerae bacterium]
MMPQIDHGDRKGREHGAGASPVQRVGWYGRTALVTCLLVVTALGVGVSRAAAETPAGPSELTQLIAVDAREVAPELLLQLGADPWQRDGDRLVFRVTPALTDYLAGRGLLFEVVCEDVYAAWEAQQARRLVPQAEDFTTYHDLTAAEAVLSRLAANHADLVVLETIGRSVQDRPIRALRVSSNAVLTDAEKPAVAILGCHHAREWISVEVPLYFAEYLVENYLKNGDVTRLLNYAEVWIVPIVNPDGFVYSWNVDRWWRKNRRVNDDGTFGVDVNRNYDYMFGGAGASDNPGDATYHGPAPFSEPETRTVRDLLNGTTSGRTFAGALSYHNYSQVIIYPWGHTTQPVENVSEYERVAGRMAVLINAEHSDVQYDYVAGQASVLLYLVNGDLVDWGHGALGIMALTVEVRPRGYPYFALPEEQIIPTCVENLPAFLYFAADRAIPGAAELDGDADGFLDDDDDCPASPGGAPVDEMGCAETEQDLDGDGVPNALDLCRDSLPGQQVDSTGCRLPTLFRLSVTSNAASVEIEVSPRDIDAATKGAAGPAGFVREYAVPTNLVLTAPLESEGRRFVHWVTNGAVVAEGQNTIAIAAAEDVSVDAVYRLPVGARIEGPARLPDEVADNVACVADFTVQIVYDDGALFPADGDAAWSLDNPNLGTLVAPGKLLAYNVSAAAGEIVGTLNATVALGANALAAEPLTVRVFDAETRWPWCTELTLGGPAEVASPAPATFVPTVQFELGPAPEVTAQTVAWALLTPAGEALAEPPAKLSAGLLTTEWVADDTPVLVRATYANDDGTTCSADLPVTILAGDPADRPRPAGVCGALGLLPVIGLPVGMAAYRLRRR